MVLANRLLCNAPVWGDLVIAECLAVVLRQRCHDGLVLAEPKNKRRMQEGGRKGGAASRRGQRSTPNKGQAGSPAPLSGKSRRPRTKGVISCSHPSEFAKSRDQGGAAIGVSGASVDRAGKALARLALESSDVAIQ